MIMVSGMQQEYQENIETKIKEILDRYGYNSPPVNAFDIALKEGFE